MEGELTVAKAAAEEASEQEKADFPSPQSVTNLDHLNPHPVLPRDHEVLEEEMKRMVIENERLQARTWLHDQGQLSLKHGQLLFIQGRPRRIEIYVY